MISLLVFLSILGLLITVHEFGHFIMAKKAGVRVEKFSLGCGPVLIRREKGGTEYSICAIPFAGYVKLAGDNLEEYKGKSDEYFSKPIGKRFLIIFFGPLLNYILGFLCFWLIFVIGYPNLTTKVGSLLDNFGAKEAGLQVGDKILAVDGQKVGTWEELQKIIQDKKENNKVSLSVSRDNKEFSLGVMVKEKKVNDPLGERQSVGLLGITPADEIIKIRHGFMRSFILAVDKTKQLTVITYKGLWRMLTGNLSIRESVTGPLGIFIITSKVANMGPIAVLQFIAILSISLCLFNILPLPILDGGHIFLLGVEKIRGKTLSARLERIVNQTGLALIITLALLVTYNDILRLFGDRIGKFFVR
ncbi:MAG: RIP metalloprotease RseP [Candidatus Omnitrophica bacterium]|nr:RIP metalloprotease RseP [Candidatus Omnitrophota bacterium]